MKWLLGIWGFPVIILFGWYALSYNDMSFGWFMLSREANDLVFKIYGDMLGLPPEVLPPLVAKAIAIDTLIVFALFLIKNRIRLVAFWRKAQPTVPLLERSSNDNLSSAP
ncbi:MAG: hypothetical protein RIR97_1809 [Pseudomonadota bacterium]|jgi:hypothetical protein